MNIKEINSKLSVADAVYVTDLEQIKALGFKSLICNRVPGEAEDHVSAAELTAAAQALGITVREIPVARNDYSDESINEFEQALKDLPQPVLAFCRSGYRAICMWALSQVNQQQLAVDEAMAQAASVGHDLSEIKTQLMSFSK